MGLPGPGRSRALTADRSRPFPVPQQTLALAHANRTWSCSSSRAFSNFPSHRVPLKLKWPAACSSTSCNALGLAFFGFIVFL